MRPSFPARIPSLLSLLKRRTPTTLYGRSLLIIVLPIAVMQILVTWFFFDAYWQRVNGHLTEGLAGDIAWVIQAYDADPTPGVFVDRHAAAQRIFVLRRPSMPSVILETHNALEPREAERWSELATIDAAADALAGALVDALR